MGILLRVNDFIICRQNYLRFLFGNSFYARVFFVLLTLFGGILNAEAQLSIVNPQPSTINPVCQPNGSTPYTIGGFTVGKGPGCSNLQTNNVEFIWEYFNGSTWNAVSNDSPSGFTYNATSAASLNGANAVITGSLTVTLSSSAATGNFRFRSRANQPSGCASFVISSEKIFTVIPKPTPTFTTQAGATGCLNTNYTYTTEAGQSGYLWEIPGVENTDYTVVSGGLGTGSNTVTLKWLTAGSKIVRINYTNAGACTAQLPTASTETVISPPPVPAFSAQAGASVCSGADVTYTTQAGSSNYIWDFPGTAGLDYSITSGGTTTSNTVTLRWLTPGSKTVAVNYMNSSGCVAAVPVSSTTSVNALPVANFTTSPGANSCVNTNVTYSTLANQTNYVWDVPGNPGVDYAILAGGIGSANNTVTLAWITTGTKTVRVNYANSDGCVALTPASSVTEVSFAPIPTVTAGGSLTFCEGGSVALTSSAGASYQWYRDGVIISEATSQSYLANSAATYTVKVSNASGCEATSEGSVVIQNPLPDITISAQAASLCYSIAGQTTQLDYSQTNNSPTTYSIVWDSAASNIGFAPVNNAALPLNTINISVPAGATGNTTFTGTLTVQNANGCVSSAKPFSLSITSPPDVSNLSVSATSGCAGTGAIVTLTSSSVVNGTYTVTYDLSGSNTSSANTAVMVFSGGTGTFLANALNAGSTDITLTQISLIGCSTPVTANNVTSFTINGLPSVEPITGPSGVCVSKMITLGNATSGGVWSSSEPSIATVNSEGVVTGLRPGSVVITYMTAPASGTGCTNTTTHALTVNPLPLIGSISGPTALCINTTSRLTISTLGGTWSSSNESVATVDNSGLVTAISFGTATISYTTGSDGAGCANLTSVLISVDPTPTVSVGAATITVCESASPVAITLAGATIGGSANAATWSIEAGGGSLSNTGATSSPGDVTYTPAANFSGTVILSLKSNASNSCTPAVELKTIEIKGRSLVVPGDPLTVCQSATPVAFALSGASVGGGATTGAWSITSGGGILSNTSQTGDPSSVTYTPIANFTGTITLTLTSDASESCVPESATRIIQVTPPPTATAGSNFSTCEGLGAVNITNGSSATNYNSVNWETSGTGTFTNNTSLTEATYTPSLNDIANGSVTITLRSAGGGCTDHTSTKTLTITKAATANAGPEIVVCTGSGDINIPGAVASNYTGVLWTEDGTGTISNPTSLTGAIYTPGANETGTVTLTLTVTGNSPCADAVSTRSIVINPNASISLTSAAATASQTPCINGSITPITYSISGGGTGAIFSGLPAGVTGIFANGVATISGTPSVSGSFSYVVSTTGTCTQTTATGTIVVSPVSVGGTLSPAFLEVCVGVGGTITLAGHTGSIVRWESSVNGGASWANIANTSTSLSYDGLRTTTYRAVVQSGVCSVTYSSASVISALIKAQPMTQASPAEICVGESSILTSTTGYQVFGIDTAGGGFNTANPVGWRRDGLTSGNFWDASGNNRANGEWRGTNDHTFNGIAYRGDKKFAIVNGNFTSVLETPVFSLIGQNTSDFKFDQAYNLLNGAVGRIEISTDGGATYTDTLAEYIGPASFGITVQPGDDIGTLQNTTISLANYIGLFDLRIRFTYIGTPNSSWAMDNITVPTTPPVTYAWTSNPSSTAFGDPVTGNVTVSPLVTTTYTLTTFIDGCSVGISTVTVIVNPLPTITPNPVVVACYSPASQVVPVPYSATHVVLPGSTYSITWSAAAILAGFTNTTGAIPASAITVDVPAGMAPATYTGTITVRNTKNCSSVASPFSIVINPLPTLASITTPPVCNVTSSTTITVALTGLLANSTSTIDYKIGNTGTVVTVTGVAGNSSGLGSFQMTVTAADNGLPLIITRISSATGANALSCSINPNVNNTLLLSVFPGYVWTGGAGVPINNWSNPLNWLCGVPQNDDNVIIPQVSNGNFPRLDGLNFRSNHFDLLGNATIELDGNELTLGNATTSTIRNEGSIIGSQQSKLVVMGVLSQSLRFVQSAPIGTTNALLTFTLNSPGQTATLGNSLWVYGNANPTAGIINSAGHLTMVSTATISSNITSFSLPSDVIGEVNVQSYFTGDGATLSYRGPRSMSSPINDAKIPNGAKKTYRQIKDYVVVTGPGGVTNGFDQGGWAQPYAETISLYREPLPVTVNGFVGIPHIDEPNIPGSGFFTFFIGQQGGSYDANSTKVNAPYSAPEAVTITYRGEINKFNLPPVVLSNTNNPGDPTNGYNLIGNPYPSAIDWKLVGKSAGVQDMFIIIKQGGGQFSYLNGTANNGAGIPNPSIIQPGQGFLVATTTHGATISFTEANKSIAYPARLLSMPEQQNLSMSNGKAISFGGDKISDTRKILRLNLFDGKNADETTIVFQPGGSLTAGFDDVIYMSGSTVTLGSMSSDGRYLAINGVPEIEEVSEIKLNVNAASSGEFKLRFTELPNLRGYDIFLKDTLFPGQLINIKNNRVYNLAIDKTNIQTYSRNRLSLVFKPQVVKALILSDYSVKKQGKGVAITWSVTPSSAKEYELEHSTDGETFTSMATLRSQGNNKGIEKYYYHDEVPVTGTNYYRLNRIEMDGSVSRSEIKTIEFSLENISGNAIAVFPNPAADEIEIKLLEDPGEGVELNIFDVQGMKVLSSIFGVSETLRCNVNALSPTLYVVEVRAAGSNKLIGRTKFIKVN